MTQDLYLNSIDVIKSGQAPNGAFLASPNFSTYQYSWLRDGTFVAYSMNVAGQHEEAAQFYRWVHMAICKHLHKVENLLSKKQHGERPLHDDFLHTRYTVDGQEGVEEWGNFQLDGYGAYLWGVGEHIERSGNFAFLGEVRQSVEAMITYLVEFWQEPNYDCWEEHVEFMHPSTLACIYGGLKKIETWIPDVRIAPTCEAIRRYVEEHGVHDGHFVKSIGKTSVDANLLWLAVPFGMFDVHDERMVRTVEKIERDLVTGGVHRYVEDTFYGGGAWILLTAWLGWYYAAAGNKARAEELAAWVERQADEDGHLPEQVTEGLLHPEKFQEWIERWGEAAKPLLWSHAMYIVLKRNLE